MLENEEKIRKSLDLAIKRMENIQRTMNYRERRDSLAYKQAVTRADGLAFQLVKMSRTDFGGHS